MYQQGVRCRKRDYEGRLLVESEEGGTAHPTEMWAINTCSDSCRKQWL